MTSSFSEVRGERSAFHVAMVINHKLRPGETLRFDKAVVNVGKGFHDYFSYYLCPHSGLYMFHLNILTIADSLPLRVEMLNDHVVIGRAIAHAYGGETGSGTMHVITWCRKNGSVLVRALSAGHVYGSGGLYSTFSGFLLYKGTLII